MEFEVDDDRTNNTDSSFGRDWQEGLCKLNQSHPILPLRIIGINRDPYAVLLTCYVLMLTAFGFFKVSVDVAPFLASVSILVFLPYLSTYFAYGCAFIFYRILYVITSKAFFLVRGICGKFGFFVLSFPLLKFNSAKTSNSELCKKALDVSQEVSGDENEQPSERAEAAVKNIRQRYVFYSSNESDY